MIAQSKQNSLKKLIVIAGVFSVLVGSEIIALSALANAYVVTDSDRVPGSYICLNNPNPKCR